MASCCRKPCAGDVLKAVETWVAALLARSEDRVVKEEEATMSKVFGLG
jgi:hypothetical protein